MADYVPNVFTDIGRDIFAQTVNGSKLVFTRMAIGDGMPAGGNYRPLTRLVSERLSLQLQPPRFIGNGTMEVTGVYTNAALNTLIEQREIGIFAIDPRDGVEKLYQYTWAPTRPDYLESGDGTTPIEGKIVFLTVIGNDTNVVVTVNRSLVFATLDDLDAVRLDMTMDLARNTLAIGQMSEAIRAVSGKYPQPTGA